jgi:hypothetical protein
MRPADIRREWDRIKGHVADILGDDERPEEVYAECRSGKAHLYLCDHGFVVLKRYVRDDTGEPEVLIWLGYGEGGKDLANLYLPELEALARKAGAKSLAFRTRRRGFERILNTRWELRAVEYQVRL